MIICPHHFMSQVQYLRGFDEANVKGVRRENRRKEEEVVELVNRSRR